MKKIISYTLLIALILGGLYLTSKKQAGEAPRENIVAFAQCLASKNMTMYGASWCSHCQNEKSHFGDAFKHVPYVECPENQQICLEKGIEGYPTWIDDQGNKFAGEQGLEGLAEITGCELGE